MYKTIPFILAALAFIGCLYCDNLIIQSVIDPLKATVGSWFTLIKVVAWVCTLSVTLSIGIFVSWFAFIASAYLLRKKIR